MKTPEEIKKGLRCHAVQWHIGECPDHEPGCKGCPYDNDYHDPDELMADALELIKELEKKVPMTNDLISREAAIKAVEMREPLMTGEKTVGVEHIKIFLMNRPAVDAAPVVHGRWIDNGIPESMLSGCSVCGFSCGAYTFNYCPHCGARMDKETDNAQE